MTAPDDGMQNEATERMHSVLEEARDLIKRLEGSTVQRLSVKAGEFEIEVERGATVQAPRGASGMMPALPASAGAPAAGGADAAADTRHPVLAPLVGTFYQSAQPGAKAFAEEGDVVEPGQTVAIVEAMKLMNEVATGVGGRVAEIVVQNGDWVEFEQVLMYIEPDETA
ncbi:MAG: acetyl-CoA carboxylase biotin carboxyl carrier protein [Thermoleophilaceae bacterium]|jgi:acetyl-CoA carboxylase biotin carboxyl carrier protein|nr:acetyl-CoA carboxylase biotin carboxyl carrier protein [Thermoleophilaceae bacterium]